ncbi:MAG: hypothetical protein KKE62_07340 [Proteobacteria bacterium]|nr:hypothetical protein [Pseudomonadota bacterium]MBU1389706.1 hypothetical protein [Pseudomonadota bacterium]MBU1542644.1 hypothetical protein [Pseudomonadota bacterium]MBU2479528.1 hypothetical protein [Pseudomonadota bacterium]
MIKKITISIPEELHLRLKEFKGYINISSSCAESLKNKIDEIDLCIQEAKKRFQILSTSEACKIAYEQGIHWAGYKASPTELAVVCNWVDNEKSTDLMELLYEKFEEIKKTMDGNSNVYEYIINSTFIDQRIFKNSMDFFHEDVEVALNFIDGARVIWGRVKKDVVSNLMAINDKEDKQK